MVFPKHTHFSEQYANNLQIIPTDIDTQSYALFKCIEATRYGKMSLSFQTSISFVAC